MIEEHALRYLLLRQISTLRERVPPPQYREVADSLSVKRDRKDYFITWSRDGHAYEKTLPRTAFSFYRKGDRPGLGGAKPESDAANLNRAKEFALEALGLAPATPSPHRARGTFLPEDLWSFFWVFPLCAVLYAVATPDGKGFALVFLAALTLEFVPRYGRALSTLSLFAFPVAGFPITTLLLGIGYAAFHALDPDPLLRRARILVSMATLAFAVALLDRLDTDLAGLYWALAMVIVATPIAFVRWTLGVHYRAMPLLLPFLSASTALEGERGIAIVLIANAGICLIARAWGWRLLERPNVPTRQGVTAYKEDSQ